MSDLYLRSNSDKTQILSLRSQEDKIPIESGGIILLTENINFNISEDLNSNIIILNGSFIFNLEEMS